MRKGTSLGKKTGDPLHRHYVEKYQGDFYISIFGQKCFYVFNPFFCMAMPPEASCDDALVQITGNQSQFASKVAS